MSTYSFGVPSRLIWLLHISFGILLVVLGAILGHIFSKCGEERSKEEIANYIHENIGGWHIGWAIFFVSIGVLAIGYHTHLWLFKKK